VGIEIITSQNLKGFCGMGCSRKSFAVLGRNYCCPRIAPAFSLRAFRNGSRLDNLNLGIRCLSV
jgi:hypothetical protein